MAILAYFFSFNGRITRTQWWIGFAILFALGIAMNVYIGAVTGDLRVAAGMSQEEALRALQALGPALGVTIVSLLLLIVMSLSFNVRRYHDRDKSGWWALIQFVPLALAVPGFFYMNLGLLFAAGLTGVIVPIWQLVELGCLAGTGGGNTYGPDPGFGGGGVDAEIAAMHKGKSTKVRAMAMPAAAPMPSMAATAGPVRFGKR